MAAALFSLVAKAERANAASQRLLGCQTGGWGTEGRASPGGCASPGVTVDIEGIIQFPRLNLQELSIERGISTNITQGTVEDGANVVDFVASASTSLDVLLTLTHLRSQLVLQGGNL